MPAICVFRISRATCEAPACRKPQRYLPCPGEISLCRVSSAPPQQPAGGHAQCVSSSPIHSTLSLIHSFNHLLQTRMTCNKEAYLLEVRLCRECCCLFLDGMGNSLTPVCLQGAQRIRLTHSRGETMASIKIQNKLYRPAWLQALGP